MAEDSIDFFIRRGTALVFELGGLTYAVGLYALSPKGVTAVVKLLINGETLHSDNINLSSHQRRTQFTTACRGVDGWEKIPKHLLTIEDP
jgi:hypothetical protein